MKKFYRYLLIVFLIIIYLTFTVNGVIAITYVVMVATMVIFQRIFWKKGDVK